MPLIKLSDGFYLNTCQVLRIEFDATAERGLPPDHEWVVYMTDQTRIRLTASQKDEVVKASCLREFGARGAN
jgi:hypothetical protein